MRTLALILSCLFLTLSFSGTTFTALLSEPKVDTIRSTASVDETIYTDRDLHKLILNNLGLLTDHQLTHSNQQMINKYGESVLTQKTLLNYLFLINADSELLSTQSFSGDSAAVNINSCSEEDFDSCILNLLYDSERDDSVVAEFEVAHNKAAHSANHFYTSNPSVSHLLKGVGFSIRDDAKGNAVIVENRSGKNFPIQKNLSKCVNDVTQSVARFDLQSGVVFVKSNKSDLTGNAIVFEGERKQVLRTFAEEICTIVSMPKFITKDSTPTLLTFYISSVRDIQKLVKPQEREIIHKTLSLAYNQFKNVLKSKFGEKQIAGQVVLTHNTSKIELQAQEKLSKNIEQFSTRQVRLLLDNTSNTTNGTTTDTPLTSSQVILRVFGVGFAIVLAIILVSLASIQVEKDTLVYSKFLTVDQRK